MSRAGPESTRASAPASRPVHWHCLTVDAAVLRLRSTAEGLSAVEAARRLLSDGPNQLPEAGGSSALAMLAGQFRSLMTWILIAAGLIAGLVGETVDALVILGIVLLNVGVGFHQEYKAERSISALRLLTAPRARLLRDGVAVELPAAEVVRGDLLLLAAGDQVAADARLIASTELACVEASLTGEAEAVSKQTGAHRERELPLGDRDNLLFMGSSVVTGSGRAVVTGTGMDTELGAIAGLIDTAGTDGDTPLQRKLDTFSRLLIIAALAVVALMFGLGWWRGTPLIELLLGSISLAVAAVPEGLPAVVTVALSMGVLRMARHRALVRRLSAVETLGSTSVICTDKTGTLTVGEMTATALFVGGRRHAVSGEGQGPDGGVDTADEPQRQAVLELGTVLVAGNGARRLEVDGSWRIEGDPTEAALLVAGLKAGADRAAIERTMPMHREYPFDSRRMRSTVVRRRADGALLAFSNGAPGPMLDACTQLALGDGSSRPLSAADREQIHDAISAMAVQALRVLGSARRELPDGLAEAGVDDIERELVFVGLTGLKDPPRPEVRAAIASCRAAGIRVVMITGDHPETASAIAVELGIVGAVQPQPRPEHRNPAVTGGELAAMSDSRLRQCVRETAVYARVTAEHKLRIVRALKVDGAVVAMTGDGVNDAPAIKGADIGIAMGRSGTEVTRQAADLIVTDDNFATIVTAVEAGRGIYDNIRKTLQYLLAGNAAELLLMLVCVLAGLPAPLLPVHLLWINLVTDGLPALCLATDPVDTEVMRRAPRPRLEAITARGFLPSLLLTGALTGGLALAVYLWVLEREGLDAARSQAFTVLVFAELLRGFGARSETRPLWRIPLATNKPLLAVVLLSIAFQLLSHHDATLGALLKTVPMSHAEGLQLLALATIPLLVLELVKFVGRACRHSC